jgi:hypothetical protein
MHSHGDSSVRLPAIKKFFQEGLYNLNVENRPAEEVFTVTFLIFFLNNRCNLTNQR